MSLPEFREKSIPYPFEYPPLVLGMRRRMIEGYGDAHGGVKKGQYLLGWLLGTDGEGGGIFRIATRGKREWPPSDFFLRVAFTSQVDLFPWVLIQDRKRRDKT